MVLEEKSYQLGFEIKILGVRRGELFHSLWSCMTSTGGILPPYLSVSLQLYIHKTETIKQ